MNLSSSASKLPVNCSKRGKNNVFLMKTIRHGSAFWPIRTLQIGLIFLFLLLSPACGAPREPSHSPVPSLSPVPSPVSSATATFTPRPFASTNTSPFASPTSQVCTEGSGRLERDLIETALLDKPMRYAVYLPPCYDFGENFPVLYLLHGQNYDEDQWIRIGAVEVADRLISAAQTPPFIIVFPYDYSYLQPTEYEFARVFLQMLIPRIDSLYRTHPQAAFRAIGGLSRGGAWAIHLGTRHPDVFGAIGAHSPAVFYTDMTTLRLRLRDAPRETFPRVYIDVGRYDSQYQTALQFARLLDEMNLPHEWHEYLGFHEEQYWSAHVEEYLRWYAEGWQ
ncbi:MAG: hypothetical protein DDG60_13485 [Anaerolineae bacterium]|nr:MAG: hypothetical protein DDG60_13485 [Anaerolineae bacterium]